MKPILLIGSDGQVGRALRHTLASWDNVIPVNRACLDLANSAAIAELIQQKQPHLIVNAAAYTAVDKAEAEPALAQAINGTAPTVMAEIAQQVGAALIHFSTDYVFNGKQNTPYREDAATDPVSVYGKTKLAGEQGIQQVYDRQPFPYLILRTAWVYGTDGKSNFVKTMLRLGAERDEVRVVADQVGTPTWAGEIAEVTAFFTQHLLNSEAEPITGIYHLTNSGVASWYDFAVAIFEEALQLGFPLKVKRVVPITTADYPTPAKRPAYSVLSCQKLTQVMGQPMLHWRQRLRQMLKELYQETYESVNS